MPLVINGEVVSDSVLEREVLRLSSGLQMDAPHAGGTDPAQLRSRALRNVVRRTLLLQAAAARGLRVGAAEVEAARRRRWGSTGNSICGTAVTEAMEQDLLLARVQAELTKHVPRPARAAVEAFYRQNQQQYHQPEAIEAAHIFRACSTPEESSAAEASLQEAEAELQRGKAFAQVADRYSDCKGVGGSVGWVTRGTMVPEFEDAAFALQPGARSPVFRSVFGLHIVTVKRRRSAGLRALNDVRLQIAAALFAAAREQELNRQLVQMERGSEIRLVESARG